MNQSTREQVVFWLLVSFVLSWVFSEVYETMVRQSTRTEVEEFINKGPRFTSDDGKALEYRIHRLEERVDALEAAQ